VTVPLSPLVRAVIDRAFPITDRIAVANLLVERCGDNLPLVRTGDAIERVRLAVLKLAAGRAEAILDHLAVAQQDWRDVLVAAGFGSDLEAHRRWARLETA
jgi:hypothetical protein